MRLFKILWKIGYLVILPLSLLAGIVGACLPDHSQAQEQWVSVGVGILIVYIFVLAGVLGGVFGWRSMETAIQATRPIPGPDEIAFRLYQEWGRPPTPTEVQVVQQALINHRNEQAVVGALSLGAIYVAGRHI